MATAAFPPGGTLLDTFKESFVDVPVNADKDNAISTMPFLEAAESLTTMFGTASTTPTYEACLVGLTHFH